MKSTNSRKNFLYAILFLVAIFFNSLPLYAQTLQVQASLYNRLGGVFVISAVVDDFTERLVSDPIITANPNIVAAISEINKPGLKFLITEFLCDRSGGPQKYTGKNMKEAHQNLKITEIEWGTSVKILLDALAKQNVPEKEKNELVALISSIKGDIVSAEIKVPTPQVPPLQVPAPLGQAPFPQVAPLPQAAPEVQVVPPPLQAPQPVIPPVQAAPVIEAVPPDIENILPDLAPPE
ncbi:MAG: hypothetical protein HYY52_04140 [Candidatus Melainabacteria bacterium]|nr:hypothetical protein [Candidatus Melainabacteria bacterium]